ncbi:MAG: hypothetical protein ACI9ES_001012 [Oceanospirillaceae bacterium]|jgi:hypothetical protein
MLQNSSYILLACDVELVQKIRKIVLQTRKIYRIGPARKPRTMYWYQYR